jgi:hypothetical protein
MEIVQDSVKFVDGQTLMKDGVNLTSIKNISDEEILRGLMANALTIISREVRPKPMCPKVYEKVIIPRVIRGDEEEVFVEEIHIDGGSFGIQGKGRNEFGEDKCFLYFRS